ncbi:MAG: hypothetical protein ACE5NG_18810, partial [bacterium]
MVIRDVIVAIETALEKMDKKYCTLSQTDYSAIDDAIKETVSKSKYLERPIAYEFYHQLRKLIDEGIVYLGGPIIQAEVDKRYQHCFENGKIPDFIIHAPNSGQNLAVIEFKLATNFGTIESDIEKLLEFKENPLLKYVHGIEVIVGNTEHLTNARKLL